MKTHTINLNASDPRLEGKYSPDSIALVECDATDAAYTVYLPDAKAVSNVVFVCVKTDASANAVTLEARNGQTIAGVAMVVITAQHDSVTVVADNNNYQRIGGTGTSTTGFIDGSGTANHLPKWTDADTLGDSIASESGDVLLIAGIPAIRNLIDEDITIPSGYTALMGNAEIATGVTVTINGDAVVL